MKKLVREESNHEDASKMIENQFHAYNLGIS